MLISTMTADEIYKELKEEYWELRNIMINIAEKCIRDHKTLKNRHHFIPPTGSKKTYMTRKNKNNWTIEWHIISYSKNQDLSVLFLSYTTYVDRAGKTHYALLGTPNQFFPMLMSSHFLQRYRERYLDLHHINTGGMSPQAYFFMKNRRAQLVSYYPKNWTAEDKENKSVYYCTHGLYVLRWLREDFPLFITFLDETCLTEYKAHIFQSEKVSALFQKYINLSVHSKNKFDPIQRYSIAKQLIQIPNAKELLIDFFKRGKVRHPEDAEILDQAIQQFDKKWDSIVEYTQALDNNEGVKQQRDRLFQQYTDLLLYGKPKGDRTTDFERKELLNKMANPEKQLFIEHNNTDLFQIVMDKMKEFDQKVR